MEASEKCEFVIWERRMKRNIEKVKENYPPALLEEWDWVRLEILTKG